MIEEIISNKSEERLKLFEEAAGITRYKQRRKQTFKLLESASRDLSRVDDVLAEVGKKVKTLKLQVRKAEKLRELKKEIRDIDLTLSWLAMEEFREKLEPMQRRIREEELLNQACTTKIASEDSALQEKELQLLHEETTLSGLQKKLNDSNQRIHVFEKQLLQYEEQQKNLATETSRITAIITEKELMIREQELLETELIKRKAPCEEAGGNLLTTFQSLVDEHDQLNTTLREQRTELDRERKLSAEAESASNLLALTKRTLESKREYLRTTGERLEIKKRATLEKLTLSQTSETELSEHITLKTAQIAKVKKRVEELKEAQERVSNQIEGIKDALLRARSSRDNVKNQILLADSVLDNFEGMPEGIGFLEKHKNGNHGLGCMSDLISLDSSYKKAVNAALGESMSYYVCQSLSEAKEGISNLTRSNKGKVNFLVLDLVDNTSKSNSKEISGAKKTLEVISYPPELHEALLLLLNKCYIVPDLETAETLALLNRDCSFITLEGETFSGKGLLYGGSSKSNEGLRLGKKAERNLLQKEFATHEKTIMQEEALLQQLRNELASINVAEQQKEIEQFTIELGGLEKRSARLDAEKSERSRDLEQTEQEIAAILLQNNSFESELTELLPAIGNSTSKSAQFREKIRRMQENLTALETRHHQFSLEVQTAQNRYKDAQLELEKLRINITTCSENRRTLQDEIKKLSADIESAEEKKQISRNSSEQIKKQLDSLLIVAAGEQKTVNNLESAYRQHQAQHHETQGELRDLRRKLEIGQQLLSTLNKDRIKLELSLDHLFTEAQVKYNCDLATMAQPEINPSFNRKAAQQQLELLNGQREQFGAVNELALEEYEGEKERFDFLTEQKEDLLSAETQLRSTIDEINKTALEKFDETFRAVRKNFIGIFRELFEQEDEVDLLIHASEDPLDAQIEIVAKPRGKKPLSIEQLSGGEKALTALSLLFAIYLVSPVRSAFWMKLTHPSTMPT